MVRVRPRRMTALIVEDDETQSALGAAMLAEFDLDVAQVRSAEDALDHLVRCAGDVGVVLVDIHLGGGMDGVALAHRIAILWPAVSVIVTSGDPLAAVPPLPAHATFVAKPWRPLDIVSVVERAARADHSVSAVRL